MSESYGYRGNWNSLNFLFALLKTIQWGRLVGSVVKRLLLVRVVILGSWDLGPASGSLLLGEPASLPLPAAPPCAVKEINKTL